MGIFPEISIDGYSRLKGFNSTSQFYQHVFYFALECKVLIKHNS